MIKIIGLVLFVLFLVNFAKNSRFRYAVLHVPQVLYYAALDGYKYMKFKRWNEVQDFGRMDIYCADEAQPFGSGKTLNMVRSAYSIYHKYDNVDVFDFDDCQWKKQYVHIFSNVKLRGIPYYPLTSCSQLVDISTGYSVPDDGNRHVYLFLIDELGRVFNNRDWKTNLNNDFLSALLQQRKHKIIIKGTVQDFSLFDATLRKVSALVYVCTKKWRFLTLKQYFAKDIERAGFNTNLLQCVSNFTYFATDKIYNLYDTNEVVGNLQKEIIEGMHLTNEEILNAAKNDVSIDTIRHKIIKRKKVS